jgi:Ca-activated chloride channel homolog
VKHLEFNGLGVLWVLAPLFVAWLAAWWLLPRWLGRRESAVRFSSVGRVRRLGGSPSLVARRAAQLLRVVVVALLILAMARPQTGRKQTKVHSEGVDIVLVLDTSGSMQALDLDGDRSLERRRNRLEVAKTVVEEFVAKRDNDQVGLVVFGNEAFTQCPLTLDHDVLASFLDRVEIGMAGDGTAIGSALGIAVKRLRDSTAKSKVIVLLTDGRNNAGALSPTKAAEVAHTFGIRIYAVGAGTRGKAPFIVESVFGRQVVYEGVEIDEATLRAIADETGGEYFRAEDREALAKVYDEIDRLEKTEMTMDTFTEYNERFRLLVTPALALLLVEVVLLGGRLRKLP